MLQSLIYNCSTFRHWSVLLEEIVGAVQSFKRQKLTDFMPKLLLDSSQMVSTDSLLEGHKSPVLNLASKPPDLSLTLWVSRPTVMSRVWQGVSKYWSYSLRQVRSLASYNRIPKQLLVGNVDYHSLDQEISIHSYSYQYLLLWFVMELFKMTDHG